MTPPYSDNEDKRMVEIFKEVGIETITPGSVKKLSVSSDGVYLEYLTNDSFVREKVGYVFINGEHRWIDRTHPASVIENLLAEADRYLRDQKKEITKLSRILSYFNNTEPQPKFSSQVKRVLELVERYNEKYDPKGINELEKILTKEGYFVREGSHAAGLLDLILRDKVGSNYSAGIDFIGDKEFYVYVEDLIIFYLNEEPILKNIPTQKFADERTGKFKTELGNEITANRSKYVIKKVDGRGGDSVWVGAKTDQQVLNQVLSRIALDPSAYIVQEFTHLSVMGDNIVDLRSITAILPDKIIVAETPWGRGLPMSGNGKVNLSDQGREVTILVAKEIKQNASSLSPGTSIRCETVLEQAQ
jgi:hypothetical protein